MNEKQMTLGVDYSRALCPAPKGWFMSEKFNDCRAYWDGEQLWTRGGHIVQAPKWFTALLPRRVHLDGGIYADGDLTAARLATQYGKFDRLIRYTVFDVPHVRGDWMERIAATKGMFPKACHVDIAHGRVCEGIRHLKNYLQVVRVHMGEGVMLRNPAITRYETGRTKNLLKVKPEFIR
jgi:DNA ligase 1